MEPKPLLLYFSDASEQAERISKAARLALAPIEEHVFPDGEIKLRLPATLPTRVLILRTLNQPNQKLIELLLAARSARDLGAQHLTLIAPYMAYMRQDTAFHPGEAVSQHVVGGFIATLFDAIITVDPHLHRVSTLQEAMPVTQAITLSAAPLLSDFIATHYSAPLLIGPDEESVQWVSTAAVRHGFDHAVCKKTRHGDSSVQITLPAMSVHSRHVVLLDDVASTGQTLIKTTLGLIAAGARSVDVAITHALFTGHAWQDLLSAGVNAVWSTDCVAHPSNVVSMAPAIADAIETIQTAIS